MGFYIQNPTTDLVFEIKDNNRDSRAQIVMGSFNGGANQMWEYRGGLIYSKLNGLVLDVCVDDKCSVLTAEKYGGTTEDYHEGTNQTWSFNFSGTIQCGTGQVLDIRDASRDQGAQVIACINNGNWSQQFRKVYV